MNKNENTQTIKNKGMKIGMVVDVGEINDLYDLEISYNST